MDRTGEREGHSRGGGGSQVNHRGRVGSRSGSQQLFRFGQGLEGRGGGAGTAEVAEASSCCYF